MSSHRSNTGNHPLLPALQPRAISVGAVPSIPAYAFLKWTFGRGSVIWQIWPAVVLHTLFAMLVVYVWQVTGRTIEIPSVFLTVMGMVIGFVISYRAGSGYDRYWMGRTAWADIIRNARTLSRLIWIHVPPRLTPGTSLPSTLPQPELVKCMAEKRMALDLIVAFAISLKHHLRGEVGIYYEDLYDLVRPLHDPPQSAQPASTSASGIESPKSTSHASKRPSTSSTATATVSPPVRSNTISQTVSRSDSVLTSGNTTPPHVPPAQPLLPASNPKPEAGVFRRINPNSIPFASAFIEFGKMVAGVWRWALGGCCFGSRKREGDEAQAPPQGPGKKGKSKNNKSSGRWVGPIHPQGVAQLEEWEEGENLPEEILRTLSEWSSVLEFRGTVPGASLGGVLGGIQQFEISLATLEQILTTPLPFIYAVHIRHVVWLFLFLLPLQLVSAFGVHAVPAVMVASFIYLGFMAAGEEIEQPFGYDDNDLDLDMFCHAIIKQDIHGLKRMRCFNAWFPPSEGEGLRPYLNKGKGHHGSQVSIEEAAASVSASGDGSEFAEEEDENGEGEGELVDVRG
ncbi:Bestrophin, RFP-TM, chloride channel-domain-containing protein [Roridomyces roridus]|uniref:Bestrophin, RFP-TM, chloride channel-domain-containing protein n=1 Tax=Roridomyces roridus TaxID=1738132 RepID=A0AAD7C166_9AGAR|nr:Bestrophin, RFP-TM, chloride channel-domain-containing protein [Roridomyces roridus]